MYTKITCPHSYGAELAEIQDQVYPPDVPRGRCVGLPRFGFVGATCPCGAFVRYSYSSYVVVPR